MEKVDSKRLDDYDRNENNPYMQEVVKHIVDKNSKVGVYKEKNGYELLETGTGELKPYFNAIFTKKTVDVQQYNKVYVSGLSSLFDLNKTEQKVLKYIYSRLEKNKDRILFDFGECQKDCGYSSKQAVYNGLCGLIEKQIIARTTRHYEYWINPSIMFNGDRLVIVNEYYKQ